MQQTTCQQLGHQEAGDHIDLEAHAGAVIDNPRFAPVNITVAPVEPE